LVFLFRKFKLRNMNSSYRSGGIAFLAAVFYGAALLFFPHAPLAQQNDDYLALFNKGQDMHEKGDFGQAVKFYDEALKILPEFPEALYQKGSALLSLNKPDDAEKAFRGAINLRADWSLPITALGSILVKRGSLPEAEILLTKAISLDELNFPAFAALAELRLRANAPADMLKELLTKLVSISSKRKPTAAIWAARGAIERSLGDKESAKKSLASALSLSPDDQFARSEKILLAFSDGDIQGALEDARQLEAISAAPENKFLLARAYAENGEKDKALDILNALGESNKAASDLKAAIAISKSDNLPDLEQTLEKEPKNPAVLGRLCNLTKSRRTCESDKLLPPGF
jgi:tetratricopeptide (TPR) repeat protein